MQELSLKEIKRYNYAKTKEYVDDELFELKHLGTKLVCLLPPGLSRNISFVDKVQESHTNQSNVETYIEKKDYLERKIKDELKNFEDSLKIMSIDEKIVFEASYIFQNTDMEIMERYDWSRNKLLHVRKSFIIKFSLSKGKDFEIEKNLEV